MSYKKFFNFNKTKILVSIIFKILMIFLSFCSSDNDFNVEINKQHIRKPSEYNTIIYGDTRTNHNIHRKIRDSFLYRKPDIVFHTGDLVNDGFSKSNWSIFNDIVKKIYENNIEFPCYRKS